MNAARRLRRNLKEAHGQLDRGSHELDKVGQEMEQPFEEQAHARPGDIASESRIVSDDTPLIENKDPFRVRIHRTWKSWSERKSRQFGRLVDFLRRQFGRFTPAVLTPQERAIHDENQARRQLDKSLRYQARLGQKLIINCLTQLGYCSKHSRDGRERITREVSFTMCEYSPLSFRYWIDARNKPSGVRIDDLTSDHTCQDLSAAVRHPVRALVQKTADGNLIDASYVIEIAGTNDIPNLVEYRDVFQQIPAAAPDLAFVVGKSKNGRLVIRQLEDLPHLLIGGQTLGGKSNMLNVLICSILARNTPDKVRFLMVDLKGGGIELMHYEGIVHLITDQIQDVKSGIAQDLDQALGVLYYAAEESNRRQKMFMESKIKNIVQWNKKHQVRRLPRIVVVIDELALLMPEDQTKFRKEVMGIIRVLASTARAAGVHLVAATQSSSRFVMNETIKVNIPGRIVFSVPDAPSSCLFIGDGEAVNLYPSGRAIWKHGTDKAQIQTPFISNSDIAQVVENAKEGELTTRLAVPSVTPEQIISWSLEKNDGSLAYRQVFSTYGDRLEQAAVNQILRNMENNVYTVNDTEYQVVPGVGSVPRKVIKYDPNMPLQAVIS